MKSIFNTLLLITFCSFTYGQDTMKIVMSDTMMKIDQKHCNIVSVGGKYLSNSLKNTRKMLSENGFLLDQEAFEYQIRLYNLPKLYYFQQLGTLINTNYASITGFGVKEDLRFPIIKNSNFVITPYLEVGGGYYRMNISKGIKSNSISTVLGSQVESFYLDNFVFTGDIGIDIGFGFNVDNRRFSVVFNGGFISNFPTEWRLASSLAFKEKINLSSPYVGVTLKLDLKCSSCDESCCN